MPKPCSASKKYVSVNLCLCVTKHLCKLKYFKILLCFINVCQCEPVNQCYDLESISRRQLGVGELYVCFWSALRNVYAGQVHGNEDFILTVHRLSGHSNEYFEKKGEYALLDQ